MPISKISQAGLDAPISLTSPTLTTPNIDSAQIPTVSGTAPLYMARAWVNFNGTGTVAIRASGNVSSITDNGTGDYTVNFTTAMTDANYSSVAGVQKDDGNNDANAYAQIGGYVGRSQTASVTYIKVARLGLGAFDSPAVYAAIFR